ncbi:Clp protease N-terminal domain-containing protein [Planomonospora parontospora]|uniref:Clp protease N-terminal domain-containing protein n=1 Tax=Planomonospora parontospora TaxID=58119 RepID=UPI001780E722|nr:Clp protease N-terminal domain-containing protein [Planomonospora parontospora]
MWRRRKVLRRPLDRLLTDHAIQVLNLAREEAGEYQHNRVSPEHLLLGLVRFDSCLAADVLRDLGISLQAVQAEIRQYLESGTHESPEEIQFTSQAEQAMELSRNEAVRLGNIHIGTEHLLLGLIGEGESAAARILVARGSDLSRARQGVISVLAREVEGRQA